MTEHERIEAHALRLAVTCSGGRAEHVGGALCIAHPRVPIDIFNRALPLGAHVDLDAIASWFDAPYVVAVMPERAALASELAERGYENGYGWMMFERDAAVPPPEVRSQLRIEQTTDAAAVLHVGGGTGFAIASPIIEGLIAAPGWTFFVGWAGDEPAATAALLVDGQTAWLGIALTRPEHRGLGGQSALIAARISRARELGATLVVTETGERVDGKPDASYRNLLRSGFRETCVRANWHSPRPGGGTA